MGATETNGGVRLDTTWIYCNAVEGRLRTTTDAHGTGLGILRIRRLGVVLLSAVVGLVLPSIGE
jgi:hypothetical protein